LCTFGVAGHALLKGVFDYAPERLHKMRARFSAPVYPGETLRTEIWNLSQGAYGFRCRVLERDVVVLDNGHAAARA
jgi:acyl dehydratase